MPEVNNSQREIAFNIGLGQTTTLTKNLDEMSSTFRRGYIMQSFFITKEIRKLVINHAISPELKKLLDDNQQKIFRLNNIYRKTKNPLIKNKLTMEIEEYQYKIMSCLQTLGFFPTKEIRQRMSF